MEYKRPVFILSYPRSGMNWTRYIIQHIYPENITEAGNLNFIHDHLVEELPSTDLPLVFCLRDYRECVIRNTREYQCVPVIDNSELTWEQLIDIDHAKSESDPGGTMCNYMVNLGIYDAWKGKKFMIRYEDMISKPNDLIAELAWFLGVYPGEFLEQYDFHYNNSINEYNNRHGSYTRGGTVRFHQDLMSTEHIELLDEKIKSFNPNLFDKYLKQYRDETDQ